MSDTPQYTPGYANPMAAAQREWLARKQDPAYSQTAKTAKHFLVDMPMAGPRAMGRAAYGEFDPTSKEGAGEALSIALQTMGMKSAHPMVNTLGTGGGKMIQPARSSHAPSVATGETASYAPKPLEGLPQKPVDLGEAGTYTPGPYAPAHQAAEAYMKEAGLPYNPPRTYAPVDPERAARIAQAYEEMPHAPHDPRVQEAYNAMIAETLAQYEHIRKTGLNVEWHPPGAPDPYANNPRGVQQDVAQNNHMWVFPTEAGYGSGDAAGTAGAMHENPLLRPTEHKDQLGRPLVANDIFRVVHDYFGHIKEGVGFRAPGEENAWRSHAAMYSPTALPAMTAETRGQNSWLNYGPHGERNRTAKSADTIYGEQKAGIMPDWAVEEGRYDPTARPAEMPAHDPAQINQYTPPPQPANPDPYAAQRGKFAQYAQEYPKPGPPDLRSRPGGKLLPGAQGQKKAEAMVEKGKAYWGKKQTPEEKEFMAARAAVNKIMDEQGYPRYFDLDKREHVDPANYPTSLDMGEAAQPKTLKTRLEYENRYDTPEARERLQRGYDIGKGIPESDRWYAMKQLEDEYIKHLGPEEGRRRFAQEFAGSMAATTGGAAPTPNFLMSAYANHLNANGLPFPTNGYQMPSPIGGRYAGGNVQQAKGYFERGTPYDANNPKRHDFEHSFLGHSDKATVDEQMSGAIEPGMTIPTWYGPATNVVRDQAARNGVAPRDFQDVSWAGLKKEKEGPAFEYDGPMIEHLNRSIHRTSVLTGRPQAKVLEDYITKRAPMYLIPGAVGVGAAAYAPREADAMELPSERRNPRPGRVQGEGGGGGIAPRPTTTHEGPTSQWYPPQSEATARYAPKAPFMATEPITVPEQDTAPKQEGLQRVLQSIWGKTVKNQGFGQPYIGKP